MLHPVDKLYNAWKDKLRNNTYHKKNYYYKFGLDQWPKDYEKYNPESMLISWPDFIAYWLHFQGQQSSLSNFWQTVTWTCLPCGFDYKLITKYETMDSDSLKIIDILFPYLDESAKSALRITSETGVDNFGHSTTFVDEKILSYQSAYLPIELKKRLKQALKWDLEMFGYDF